MNAILVAAPTAEPFTVAEAKALARTTISSVAHDALLTRLIATARKKVEDDTGRKIGAQQWQYSQAYWPKSRYLTLQVCPLISVQSVTYVTLGGTQTLNADAYTVQVRPDTFGKVSLNTGQTWPTATLLHPGLTVAYTCGHNPMPEQLKEAIGTLIVYWYDNPEAAIASTAYKAEVGVLPLRYQELIAPFKLWGK